MLRRVCRRLYNTNTGKPVYPDNKRVEQIIADVKRVTEVQSQQHPQGPSPLSTTPPSQQPHITYNIVVTPNTQENSANQPVVQKKKNKLTTEEEFKVVKKWMPMITMIFGSALRIVMDVISKRK
jgi:hypothetical protein